MGRGELWRPAILVFILYQYIPMEMKKIGGKKYVKCYGPNSLRYEPERDNQKAYYQIYINGEHVETCPLCCTLGEATARFHELLEENGIEDDEQFVRKEII